MDDHDFRMVSGAHRGPPAARAAGRIERVIAFRMQAVVILAKNQPGNELQREDLTLMNVAGKLQVDAGRAGLREQVEAVKEQDRQVRVETW